MNAKKLIYIAVAAVSSALLSCSDDLLDKKPLEGYSEIDVFANEALVINYINGTYRGLRHPFDDTENSLTDGLTDNAYNQHGSAASIIKTYTRGEVDAETGEGVTRGLWSLAYSYIRRTNLFFERTAESPIEADRLAPRTGEMRYIRAFLYFDLLRWYGGVPLITQTFNLDDPTFDVGRASADEVAAFIVSECDAAILTLPSIADVSTSIPEYKRYKSGMASKEAAMALKARTLLYIASPLFNETNDQSKWTAARDANKAVMDLTTVSLVQTPADYGAMFRGENSNEVIFARYFTQINNQGWGINLWLYPNSYGGWANTTPTQNLVDSYELTNGELPSSPTSGYDDQDPYVDRDPRFYQSILYNGASFRNATVDYFIDKTDSTNSAKAGKDSQYTNSSNSPHNASRTGYNFRKYTQETKDAYSGNMGPWIIFRLAEFYLNYAEAEIALNNEQEARDAINAVRTRVGMPDVTESGTDLEERYRRERNVELTLEDHRFFDMRRWKLGNEMLGVPARRVGVYKNGSVIEYVYDGQVVVGDERHWDDKMYLLPIPASEIQRSHETLTQNPDY